MVLLEQHGPIGQVASQPTHDDDALRVRVEFSLRFAAAEDGGAGVDGVVQHPQQHRVRGCGS